MGSNRGKCPAILLDQATREELFKPLSDHVAELADEEQHRQWHYLNVHHHPDWCNEIQLEAHPHHKKGSTLTVRPHICRDCHGVHLVQEQHFRKLCRFDHDFLRPSCVAPDVQTDYLLNDQDEVSHYVV